MSPVGGPGAASKTLGELIAQWPPRAPALAAPGVGGLSYGELGELLADTAGALRDLGIGRNHRVGVALGHGVETAACVLSIADYCALVPIHPDLRADEARVVLDAAELTAVVVAGDGAAGVRKAAGEARVGVLEITVDERGAGRGGFVLRAATDVVPATAPTDTQDLALILSTSGSTARPKLVPHTMASLISAAINWARFHELQPADCTILCLPLFHSFGLTGCIAPTMVSGGSVLCLDALEPAAVLGAVDEVGATWLSCVPTMLQGIVRHLDDASTRAELPTLRFVRTGTAQLTEDTRQAAEHLLQTAVLASYGLSETGSVASNPSPPGVRRPGTVGVAYGAEVAVIDAAGADCEPGEVGEVIVRGDTVTDGYLNDPEENERLFVGDWLRTGDQGFLDADGFLTLVGRTKHMINRGGQSLSPLEIEQAIATHPAVAEVAIVGFPHDTLGEEVAAAIVWHRGQRLSHAALAADLSRLISPQKVPTRWLDLEQLPRSAVGKVANSALVEEFNAARRRTGTTALGSAMAQRIASIWTDVLGLDDVRSTDNFVGVGGDSLTALALVDRLVEEFGVQLEAQVVLASQSLEELAAVVAEAPSETRRHSLRTFSAVSPPTTELSLTEQGLWLEEQLVPGTSRYHEPMLLQLSGALYPEALAGALNSLAERHEALRTAFPAVAGAPERVVHDAVDVELVVDDCVDWEPEDILDLIHREVDRAFDLGKVPLWRSRLLQIDDQEYLLLLTVHHIVNDRRSSQTMLADLRALYAADPHRGPASLTPLAVTPSGFSAWQRAQLAASHTAELTSFWADRLADVGPSLSVPGEVLGVSSTRVAAEHATAAVGSALVDALTQYCMRQHATPFVVLQAALKQVLADRSGSTDVVLGTPVDVRATRAMDGVVGCFVNTIALRSDLSQASTFAELVDRERALCYSAYAHQQLPFETVVADLRASGADRAQLCDAMFSIEEVDVPEAFAPGLGCARVPWRGESCKFDLSISASVAGEGGMDFEATYRAERYPGDLIAALLADLVAFLEHQLHEYGPRT